MGDKMQRLNISHTLAILRASPLPKEDGLSIVRFGYHQKSNFVKFLVSKLKILSLETMEYN